MQIALAEASASGGLPGSHASTFGGNPVSIAAALATLDILEREAIDNAARVGDLMMRRMQTWIAKYRTVGDVRGRGLMIGVEIVRDQESRTPAGDERDAIIQRAFERGVLCLGAGPNTIRLSPPLIVSQEQAGMALDILEECIAQGGSVETMSQHTHLL